MKKLIVIFLIVFLSINLSAQVFDHIYTNNVSWNSDPVLTGSIWIRPGVSLTINSGVSVQMPDNSFIFVDVGAKIIANGVTFEAANNYWLGITCRGTNSIYTTAPYEFRTWNQPLVQISNSIIRGMSGGISSNSMFFNYSNETPNTTGGGILKIDNTQFNLNLISPSGALVSFYHNRRIVNGNHLNEQGYVIKCSFKDITEAGVLVHSSRNVKIIGCDFNGHDSVGTLKTGVFCNDGSVVVDAHYTSNINTYCSFDNLKRGINIIETQVMPHNSLIRQATFSNCFQGVTALGSQNLRILSNSFDIPSHATDECHGIHLTGCTAFQIEDNTLTTTDQGNAVNTYGIVIHGSGENPNLVYRNTFVNCNYGLVGQQANRGGGNEPELGGLKFQCNDFSSFDDAWYMAALTTQPTNDLHGISTLQAGAILGLTNETSPCYNSMVVRDSGTIAERDFLNQHIPVLGFDILYIIPGSGSAGVYDLKNYSPTIKKQKNQSFSISTPHCESRLPCFGPACPIEPPVSIANFQSYDPLMQILHSMVNGGDHAYMMNLVNNVSPSTRLFVYYELLNNTPSLDILANACANDMFYNSMIRDILVENSYGIKSQSVRDALEQRYSPLTTQEMAQIESAAQSISDFEELLFQLSSIKMEYYTLMNAALNYYLDLEEMSIDDVKSYLTEMNDYYSLIRLCMIELEEGDFTAADNVLSEIQGLGVNSEEITDFEIYYSIVRQVYDGYDGDFYRLNRDDKTTLSTISNNESYASYLAKALIVTYFEEGFNPVYLVASTNSQRKSNIETQSSKVGFRLYPNPASDEIFVIIPEDCTVKVVITNIQGKLLLSKVLQDGSAVIEVGGLSDGLYFVSLYENNRLIKTEKLIKN